MKRILIAALTIFALSAPFAFAAPVSNIYRSIVPEADNTYYIGTTSPSNFRYNGNFNNLTVTGTCTGCGSSSGQDVWQTVANNQYITPTTTLGAILNASSTIGDGTQAGGLTINGGATTTGRAYFAAGTVSAPSISFIGRPGQGFWDNGGQIEASIGSADVLSIQSNGTVWEKNNAGGFYVGAAADVSLLRYASGVGSLTPFMALGSTTIGAGGQTTGLTISGGATTTLNAYFASKVGIGATAPFTQLDVQGTSGITSFTGTSNLGVMVEGANSTNDYSGIDFDTRATQKPKARIAAIFGNSGSLLQFGTSNSYGAGITNTAMTIDYNGLVGIGSTSPFARLSVHANNGDTNTVLFAIGSSTSGATTTLFSVNNTGNTTIAGLSSTLGS